MANLFAQATANWTAANEWNTAANGSGSFVTPGAGDVCMANGFTVTITANVTVAEIRNDTTGGATAGGYFTCSTNGVTVTANVYAGSVVPANSGCFHCAHASPNVVNLVGNVTGGSVASSNGANNTTTGTLNITGNVTGGSNATARGVLNTSTGTINVTGDVTGNTGVGLYNSVAGTVNVTGNAIAGAINYGLSNTTTGTMTISGYCLGNGYGPGSAGVSAASGANNTAQGILEVGEVRNGALGYPGVTGAFRFASTTAAAARARATSGHTEIPLRPTAQVVPAIADVKSGVVYGDAAYTGTLVATGGPKRTNMTRPMGA